jgi:hypothetical protein
MPFQFTGFQTVPYFGYQTQPSSPVTCQPQPQGQYLVTGPMPMSPQSQSWSPMGCPVQMQPCPGFPAFTPTSSPTSTPPQTPDATPAHSTQRAAAAFPAVWQTLDAQAQKSSRRGKEVAAAKPNEVTLMLRHLPLDYTPDALLDEIKMFLPYMDFYYLPTNFETKKNLGYGFVNFVDRAAAQSFLQFWEQAGIKESGIRQEEAVIEARVQGFEANVEKFRNSSVMAVLPMYLKPRIYRNGQQLRFPGPDKKLRPVGHRFKPTTD